MERRHVCPNACAPLAAEAGQDAGAQAVDAAAGEQATALGGAPLGEPTPRRVIKVEQAASSTGVLPGCPLQIFLSSITDDEVNVSVKGHFRSRASMQEFLSSLLSASDETMLERKRLAWTRMQRCITEWEQNIKKATADLARHVNLTNTAMERERKKAKEREEKLVVAAQKEDLKKRAAAMAAEASAAASEVPSVFQLPPDKTWTAMKRFAGEATPTMGDFDKPFVITKSKRVQQWMADSVMAQVLAAFGGRYKKQLKDGKVSMPLLPKQGKEVTESFFKNLLESWSVSVVDIGAVSASWMQSSWLFGWEPMHTSLSVSPNSAACLRILWFGELEVTCVSLTGAMKYLRDMGTAPANLDALRGTLSQWSAGDVAAAQGAGVAIYHGQFGKEDLCYVPCGWFLMERVKAGSTLLYGVRKSLFISTDTTGVANYVEAKGLLAGSGSNVQKMDEILRVLQQP